MKDSIVLTLPYPVRFLGVQFMRSRKIGFLFTNLSMFLFREAMGFQTSEDFTAWQKQHGDARAINEMMYYSAVAYCMENKAPQNFTKSLLTVAISACSEDDQKRLIEAWRHSQTFGAKIEKKKKLPNQLKSLITPKNTRSASVKLD